MVADHYAILRVAPSASREQIKRAYRQRARELHSDMNPSPDADDRMRELTDSYKVLSSDKRAAYDKEWREAAAAGTLVPFAPPKTDLDLAPHTVAAPGLDPSEVSFGVVQPYDRAIKQVRVKVRNQGRYPNLTLAFEPDEGEFWIAHWSEVSPGSFTVSTALSLDRWKPEIYRDQLWVYWREAPERRSKLAISMSVGHASGSISVIQPRQLSRSGYVGAFALLLGWLLFGRHTWIALLVAAVIAGLGYGGYHVYLAIDNSIQTSRQSEAERQQQARQQEADIAAIPAVCNQVFNDADFSRHVDPVLNRHGYKYSVRESLPSTRTCDWRFNIEGSLNTSAIAVSVQCGALASSTWGTLPDAVTFDSVPGAYFSVANSKQPGDGRDGDRAILRTSSGELAVVYVRLFTSKSSSDYPPLSHRKEVLAAVLPVVAEREAALHIC